MTEQMTRRRRRLSMLERMEEASRRIWMRDERSRHEEFVQALRDPARAASTIADACRELVHWERDSTRTAKEIARWRKVLSFPAEKIAMLLEEQSHPLLQERSHESPFRRGRDDLQEEAFHQEMLKERQPVDYLKPIRELRQRKRQLSLVKKPEERYCSPMNPVDPSHPGIYVREHCLERFNLSVTEGARVLGVSRQALTNLVTGRAGISPEMALRLDLAFGGGAETWLQRQVLHDLGVARRRLAQLDVIPVASERQPALF